jgi:hypothetical protein
VDGVASCGPYPDSQIAVLMSEVAFGKVLMRKVFKAPADCPNKRTFFYCGSIISMISKKSSRNGVEKRTGFPPNAAIFDWTHSNPRMTS